MNRFVEAFLMASIAAIPVAHAWWCWSRGVYHARSLRIARAERPIEFWFWMGTNLVLSLLMMVAAAAMLFRKG